MGAPLLMKVAFGVSAVALLIQVVAYSTNSWDITRVGDNVVSESGLWNTCILGVCRSNEILGGNPVADEIRTVRAFSSIALILLISVTVALFLALCIEFFRNKLFVFLEMGTAIAAGVLILIAVIIYGSSVIPSSLGAQASWSLGLSVIAALLAFTTGILVAVGGCCSPTDNK